MGKTSRQSFGVLALSLVAWSASATLVTLPGSHLDVVYDDAQATLQTFGQPTLVGDLLTFSPSNFKAQSTDGLVLAANTVNVKIQLHDGFRPISIGLSEGGDYIVWGAASFANAGGQTRAFDTSLGPPGVVQTIVPSGLGTVSVPPSLVTTNWSASAQSDLSAATFANTREISYSIQDILAAFAAPPSSGSPTLGFVEKKFVAVNVAVAAIPEPEVWAMLVVGFGVVGLQVRRRARGKSGKAIRVAPAPLAAP